MVKYFHFKANDHVFSKQLESVRYTGISKTGNQCGKRCLIGTSKCWIHLLSDHKLRIKPATNPAMGLGLFACNRTDDNAIVFRKDDLVIVYGGETITLATLHERYMRHTAPYGVEIRKDALFKDCAVDRCIGGHINHGTNRVANCRFVPYRGEMKIRSVKNVRNNEELFVNYGRTYNQREQNVISTTSSRKRPFAIR